MITDSKERARRYIARMPPSIQGQKGSDAFFNVALVLVRKFELSWETAFELLAEWNLQRAQPLWSDAEIRHKLKDAMQKGKPVVPAGNPSAAKSGVSSNGSRGAAPAVYSAPPNIQKGTGAHSSVAVARKSLASALTIWRSNPLNLEERKARQRAGWPEFRNMSLVEMEELARLRSLPVEVVYQAHSLAFLRFAEVDGHRCYILLGDNFAQARRMDGGKLVSEGKEVKSKNLLGSTGAFFGQHLLGMAPSPILLVEGCVGLLEGLAAIRFAGVDEPPLAWTVLAAVSATSRFDAGLLNLLKGRRIRILPDAGTAGMDFCAISTASLRSAGSVVDAFRLPEGIGDLGPIVAEPDRHASFLKSLFTL